MKHQPDLALCRLDAVFFVSQLRSGSRVCCDANNFLQGRLEEDVSSNNRRAPFFFPAAAARAA
jgi:hypothetical protein